MSTNERGGYWSRRQVSRRRLLGSAGAMATGLVGVSLVGCGDDDDDDGGNGTNNGGGGGSATAPAGSTATATAGPKRGGTLNVGVTYQPSTLDPQFSSNGGDAFFIDSLFNGLLSYDKDGKLHQERALTSSYETVDDTTLTFHLREGITFSNGEAMNAAAVKFTIERGQDATAAPVVLSNLRPIIGIDTPDDYTVTLKLSAPSPGLLTDLGGRPGYVLPPEAVAKAGDTFGSKPIGTGPFTLSAYAPGSQVSLKRNETYWRKDEAGGVLPYVDAVNVKTVLGAAGRLAGLTTGDLQIAQIDTPDVPKVESSSDLAMTSLSGGTINSSMLVFNWTVAPCDDVNVRRAVAWAVNAAAANQAVYGGLATEADAFLYAPGSWAYQAIAGRPKFDVNKAKAFLAQSGYPDGLDLPILCHSAPAVQQQTQIYQEALRQVGIRSEITVLAVSEATTRMFRTGGVPLYSTTWGVSAFPDSAVKSTLSKDGFYNPAKTQSNDLQTLIEKATTTYDEEERKDLFNEIALMDLDQCLFVPVLYGTTFAGARKNVAGLENIWRPGSTWIYDTVSLS